MSIRGGVLVEMRGKLGGDEKRWEGERKKGLISCSNNLGKFDLKKKQNVCGRGTRMLILGLPAAFLCPFATIVRLDNAIGDS